MQEHLQTHATPAQQDRLLAAVRAEQEAEAEALQALYNRNSLKRLQRDGVVLAGLRCVRTCACGCLLGRRRREGGVALFARRCGAGMLKQTVCMPWCVGPNTAAPACTLVMAGLPDPVRPCPLGWCCHKDS